MGKTIDTPTRLREVAREAAQAFIEAGGYRRTQMSDIARRLGLSPGALYLYVESKEALFDLAVRVLYEGKSFNFDLETPLPTPAPGATLTFIRQRIRKEELSPTLVKALTSESPGTIDELDTIVREMFALINERRTLIMLLTRCANDFPDLAATWLIDGREVVIGDLAAYLRRGIEAGSLAHVPDVELAARSILEVVATWAMDHYWEPLRIGAPPASLERTARTFAVSPFRRAAR